MADIADTMRHLGQAAASVGWSFSEFYDAIARLRSGGAVVLPSDSESPMPNKKLPDTDQWINRVEIKSESSNRVYVVAQNKAKRHWACACPGYKSHRKCKHLTAMGLPGSETPYELPKPKAGFTDGYDTYDASEQPGDPSQWRSAIQTAKPKTKAASRRTPVLRRAIEME